jgi:hypothetical protein
MRSGQGGVQLVEMKDLFKCDDGLIPEDNYNKLNNYIAGKSRLTMERLGNWLGREVKIIGDADAENMRYIMTFIHTRLGPLGEVDLIFESEYAIPRWAVCRVWSGSEYVHFEQAHVSKRKEMMSDIRKKAKSMFAVKQRWHVSYYSGKDLLESRTVTDDDMARVKTAAYRGAPPGADMIKLVTPKGKTLIRTEKKRWVREG